MKSVPAKKASTWTALRNPAFRTLWIASLVSGTCVAAHDTAATWTMNMVAKSPLFLSLMSTVASLPFFLFTLPAGALADMMDRKRLMYVMNVWLAASAGGLAIAGWLHLLKPYVLLSGVFLIGVGFAFNSPAWTAIQPEIVSDEELPSAATLGGLQLNISGIIGPAIGGFLLPLIGANFIFALNACCFLLLLFAIVRIKRKKGAANLPLENFLESFLTAIRYTRYAPGIRIILARNILFAFFISIIPALLPIVGLKVLHLDPSKLGLVFTCMGIGSVTSAVTILPWARGRFSSNAITVFANLLVVTVFLLMALVRNPGWFLVAAALGGAAWTMAAAELWVAGQRAMPSWARGRMNATVIMAAQGAVALGGVIWGAATSTWGVTPTLLVAAVLLALSLIPILFWLSIDFTGQLDVEPVSVPGHSHRLIHVPHPHDGPIAVTIEFQINRATGRDFLATLRDVRLIHLRNGAFSWRLHEDLGRLNTYRIEVTVPSWTEYLLEQERLTKTERETIDKAWSFHVGPNPPETRHFLCVNRELHTRHHLVTRPSSMPEAPLSIDRPAPEPAV
ncbi:MAG: MFS transporter [Verrucomicrobia bacterium]|nr:MFS transporter [Verrucomicrobiota bacterium]